MFLLLDKGFSKGTILFCQFALLLLSFIFISFIFVNNIEEKIPSPLHIVLSYGTFLLKSEVYKQSYALRFLFKWHDFSFGMKSQWISKYVGSPVFVIELCKIATVDRMSIERAVNFL